MKEQSYAAFEAPFRELAAPLLEKIREKLIAKGYGPFTKIEGTDHDVDRGMEFRLERDPCLFVEARLIDGDWAGLPGVGVSIDCSIFAAGTIIWGEQGLKDPQEVVKEIEACPVDEVVQRITEEWARVEEDNRREQASIPAGARL